MDFTKFVSLLDRQALFLCRGDELEDPFEGSISPNTPPVISPDMKEWEGQSFQVQIVDISDFKEMVYVNCWHAGEIESEAMWRLYAREQDGIAIRTVFHRFKEALIDKSEIYVSRVKYVDYRTTEIPWHNSFIPMVHKRKGFEHENEVRALFLPSPNPDKPDGYYYDVDVGKLVVEIVVAPFAEKWFFELVCSTAERYGIADRVRRSVLSEQPRFQIPHVFPKKE